jgi:hypothetical protein
MACADTPGFINPFGATCKAYVSEGHCANGKMLPGHEWATGRAFGFPERHCCACGRPGARQGSEAVGTRICTHWEQAARLHELGDALQSALLRALLRLTERHPQPLQSLCEVNAGSVPRISRAFLSRYPNSIYRGLAFGPSTTLRCIWPAKGGEMCFGDSHRSVLSPTAARLVECDALIVRADEPVPDPERTTTYNIVRGLPDAVRRLRREGPRIIIVHGKAADREAMSPPGLSPPGHLMKKTMPHGAETSYPCEQAGEFGGISSPWRVR